MILSLLFFAFTAFAQKAVVIIDMQKDFVTRNQNHQAPDNQAKYKALIESQRRLIREAKEKRIPILLIEFEKFGETDPALTAEIGDYDLFDKVFKTSSDWFARHNVYREQLKSMLQKHKAEQLIVAGANGGACVLFSIHSALSAGHQVLAACDGIADFNFSDFTYPYEDWREIVSDLFKPTTVDRAFSHACEARLKP